jgi:NADH-quinone oxidoreductase subunit M
MANLLVITLFLPLAGALTLGGDRRAARWLALTTALLTLAMAVVLVARYPGGVEPFAVTDWTWLGGAGQGGNPASIDVRFSVALDGLSVWLFGLTALLSVTAILIGWEAVEHQPLLYYRLLLILETGMLGVFVARDILLFYVFFEFTLIPLFFLIGIWGSEDRRPAAMKFFLFTLTGSLLTLLGLLSIVFWVSHHPAEGLGVARWTFSIPQLTEALSRCPMDAKVQLWVFVALFAGFAVKVPLFPLHTWLPLAHVQAPAAGSILLAGVLLKIGTYGFARFSLPMLPDATVSLMPILLWLSVAGILYGALVALAQRDIKRLIAYSSVSHMGFCMLGLFAIDRLGIQGSVLQMVNHGLSTGGLFAVVGMLYERYHTRQIDSFGGLTRRLPVLAFFTLTLTFSSIGLPGLNGFASEFLLLLGMFQRAWAESNAVVGFQFRIISVLSVFGVVLGAWYMLWMYQRVFFGPLHEPSPQGDASHGHAAHEDKLPAKSAAAQSATAPKAHAESPVSDLSLREIMALSPLLVFIVWIGLQPSFFLSRMAPTLDQLLRPAQAVMAKPVATEKSQEPQTVNPPLQMPNPQAVVHPDAPVENQTP